MICPDCGHDNISGVDECEACGQPLVNFDHAGNELEQGIARHNVEVLCPQSPVTIGPGEALRDAVARMVEHKIGCLLVVENNGLTGIITERDVLNNVSADDADLDRAVAEVMTASPMSIKSQDSIAYALHAMDLGGHRHLPILDDQGSPTGIISVRDILRFLCVRYAESGVAAE